MSTSELLSNKNTWLKRKVVLPTDSEFAGKTGTVVGWGRTSEGGSLAAIAQQVNVPILSLAECRKLKYRPSRITNNMVCAGKGAQDSCQVSTLISTV